LRFTEPGSVKPATGEIENGYDYGATAADKIIFFSSVDFFLTSAIKDKPGEAPGAADRKGWSECRPEPTVATDPESGC
jgi:hypothetical protein